MDEACRFVPEECIMEMEQVMGLWNLFYDIFQVACSNCWWTWELTTRDFWPAKMNRWTPRFYFRARNCWKVGSKSWM